MGRFQYFIKLVIYSIITFYVLQVTICLWCLKLFLKKWEFTHLGCFPGQVAFQGDYGYSILHARGGSTAAAPTSFFERSSLRCGTGSRARARLG